MNFNIYHGAVREGGVCTCLHANQHLLREAMAPDMMISMQPRYGIFQIFGVLFCQNLIVNLSKLDANLSLYFRCYHHVCPSVVSIRPSVISVRYVCLSR